MKKLMFLFFLMVALAFVLAPLFGQESDLTGTWVGSTYIADSGDDQVTLVLEKEGEAYSGTVSDSMGMANEAKLENGKFVNGTLTGEFTIFNGSDYMKIKLTLKLNGELLVGNWESADGESGSLELKRKS
jgi:hypothetical protein